MSARGPTASFGRSPIHFRSTREKRTTSQFACTSHWGNTRDSLISRFGALVRADCPISSAPADWVALAGVEVRVGAAIPDESVSVKRTRDAAKAAKDLSMRSQGQR